MVFGPGKLPEIGRALVKGIGEFKRTVSNEPAKDGTVNIEAKPVEKKPDVADSCEK